RPGRPGPVHGEGLSGAAADGFRRLHLPRQDHSGGDDLLRPLQHLQLRAWWQDHLQGDWVRRSLAAFEVVARGGVRVHSHRALDTVVDEEDDADRYSLARYASMVFRFFRRWLGRVPQARAFPAEYGAILERSVPLARALPETDRRELERLILAFLE